MQKPLVFEIGDLGWGERHLVKGEVELTIGDETQIVKAPIMFKSESNVYHKLIALTDIELVTDRESEK